MPYVPDQRIPDVTVRSNENLPDPDVKMSHNEWYAVSWEMDFGKQIDEHETTKSTEANQQVEIQEVTNTNDGMTTSPTPRNQIEDTNDVALLSPDFSKLTTDVGDNPYVRRPPPIESLPYSPEVAAYNCWV